ncbi:MAG: protein kinase [Candidatus Riflebacteria bacterium]|nr:protein kinase [Candidatus Riflebacteria bacterium]
MAHQDVKRPEGLAAVLSRFVANKDAKAVLAAVQAASREELCQPAVARLLAWAHLAEHHPAKAFACLKEAEAIHPDNLSLLRDVGDLALRMGQWTDALKAYERLSSRPRAELAREGVTALELASRLLACWSPLGQYDKALKLLEQLQDAARPTPALYQAFEECFQSAAKVGRRDVAVNGLSLLARWGGEEATANLKLAELQLELGEPEEAEGRIKRVLASQPGHVLARLLLRRARGMLTVKRIRELRILLDHPGKPYDGKGIQFAHEGVSFCASPSAAFKDALANRPHLVENELLLALARSYFDGGEWEESLRFLQRIRLPEPFLTVEVTALKGLIWLRKGFPDLALAELGQAGARALVDEKLRDAALALTDLLEQNGRVPEALKAARLLKKLSGVPDQADRIARLELKSRTQVEDDLGPSIETARAPARAAVPTGQNEVIDGNYEVLQPLGQGGMGVVLKVLNRKLDRVEALKLLPERTAKDAPAVELLVQEARALAVVSHPNIVKVFGLGEHNGRPYLTMEFLEGETLTATIRRRGRLEVGEILGVARQVALGLRAAHAGGIVHRDVKPENIMLTAGGQRVKLMDFGLARDLSSSGGLRQESFMGTIHYISPEQINGQNVDHRTDVYSFGVVLYEMLTGQPPFDSPNPHNLMFMHLTKTPPSPRVLRPEIPVGVEALVLHCLEKAPERRPSGFDEVLKELPGDAGGSA